MKKLGFAGLTAFICLASALPVMAQAQPNATEACNNKVRAYLAKPEDTKLFDDFVNDATCKDSMYREGAYSSMMQQLVPPKGQKWKEAYDLSNRYEKEVPNKTDQIKKYIIPMGLTAASQLGEIDKILEVGEKVLVIEPADLNAMVILSNALPEKYPSLTDQAAKDKNLNRAQELAKKLIAMPRIQQLDEKTWQTSVVGPAHAVLGFVALQRTQYQESSDEYEQATKIVPKDQMSWFRGGLAKVYIATAAQKPLKDLYDQANDLRGKDGYDAAVEKRDAAVKEYTEKRDAAMDSLATAAAMGGAVGDAAKMQLQKLWEPIHDNTTTGMDDFIAKHKIQ